MNNRGQMEEITSRMAALKIKNAPKIIYINSPDGPYKVVLYPKRVHVKTKAELSGWVRPPPRDEVEDLVREWYAAKGEPVPKEDLDMCRAIREADAAHSKAFEEATAAAQKSAFEGAKPEFGTPEFWAWTKKRRAAENAEREAKGLPPLSTTVKAKATKQTP